MSFHAYDVAIELLKSLKKPLEELRTKDAGLAKQAREAAQSVPLNIAEARKRFGGDRQHIFRVALGSAGEVRAALDSAMAWDYLQAEKLEKCLELLDREIAMLYRLGGGP